MKALPLSLIKTLKRLQSCCHTMLSMHHTAESALLIHFLFWLTGMLTVMGRTEFVYDACVLSQLLFCFSHSVCGSQCDVCRSEQERQLLDFQIENAVFFFFLTCPFSVSFYDFMHFSFSCSRSVFP